MTDHSILNMSTADLPFREEARAVSRVLQTIFVDLPNAFASAIRAKHMFDDLQALDSAGLEKMGIRRSVIIEEVQPEERLLPPQLATVAHQRAVGADDPRHPLAAPQTARTDRWQGARQSANSPLKGTQTKKGKPVGGSGSSASRARQFPRARRTARIDYP